MAEEVRAVAMAGEVGEEKVSRFGGEGEEMEVEVEATRFSGVVAMVEVQRKEAVGVRREVAQEIGI